MLKQRLNLERHKKIMVIREDKLQHKQGFLRSEVRGKIKYPKLDENHPSSKIINIKIIVSYTEKFSRILHFWKNSEDFLGIILTVTRIQELNLQFNTNFQELVGQYQFYCASYDLVLTKKFSTYTEYVKDTHSIKELNLPCTQKLTYGY